MTRPYARFSLVTVLCLAALPNLALAHPGHGEPMSFMAGALHPMSGLDHLAGFLLVGVLIERLRATLLRPLAAVFLGLLIAAWTSGSDGWQYAAGFMLAGGGLAAIAMTATRLTKRAATAAARRSRT